MEEVVGLLFVFGFWAVAFAILGGIATLGLQAATAFLTRKATSDRKVALFASTVAPWTCIAVWIVGTICYAAINVTIRGRDLGFGDSYSVPLPTGYSLDAIDTLDFGEIYRTSALHREDGEQPVIEPIFQLQIDGATAAGTSTSVNELTSWYTNPTINRYFILNMTSGSVTQFDSRSAWRDALARRGLREHLEPFASVFAHYSTTWFDWLALAIAASVPLIALAFLALLILRARRTAAPEGQRPVLYQPGV